MGSVTTAEPNPPGELRPGEGQQAGLTLTLAEMKDLCVVVAADMGLVVAETRFHPSGTDVFFSCNIMLHPRRVLIRATIDELTTATLHDVAEEAHRRQCADYLIITARPLPAGLAPSDHVLGPEKFLALLRSSHAIAWSGKLPRPRRSEFISARRRARRLQEVDRLGLAWLPSLSRFKHPWQLRESATPPDEWFERIVFQLATSTFRLGGLRLGTAKRGQRVGDALLWRDDNFILLDCKAAQDGYRLGIDDERRLLEYAGQSYTQYGFSGQPRCVVLVSSSFPTFDEQPRRFADRRRRFTDAGSDLACIRADDLIEAALELLDHPGDTRAIDGIAWCDLLTEGMVSRQTLVGSCRSSLGPR